MKMNGKIGVDTGLRIVRVGDSFGYSLWSLDCLKGVTARWVFEGSHPSFILRVRSVREEEITVKESRVGKPSKL
jgi:hypothetical protein